MQHEGTTHWLRSVGAGVRAHLRWVGRGLRGWQTRLVVVYLAFLALLLGFGAGWMSAPFGLQRVNRSAHHVPPPVTPPPAGHRWVEVLTTGYCPCAKCCGKHADGRTAINRDVNEFPYGIAVDHKLIPMRTWLFVPGYGEMMVDDKGGAMRQSGRKGVVHLDLRFKTHQEALNWGRRWMWISMPEDLPAARSYGQ